MKTVIVIPTYNEKLNIKNLLNKIIKLYKSKFHIVIIDDNSPDKTNLLVKKYSKYFKFIKLIQRPRKMGIGSAHKTGIKYAYKKKFEYCITMDADGTHDPRKIKSLLSFKDKYDIVITNRFLKKNSLKDWPVFRIILTNLRHCLISFFLKLPYDSSGAFRCYNIKKIKLDDITKSKDNGYSFFWESLYLLNLKKYKIKEIPIYLPSRTIGSSKMQIYDIIHALKYLIYMYFKKKY